MTPEEAKKFIGKLVETENGITIIRRVREGFFKQFGSSNTINGNAFHEKCDPIYRDDPRLSDREE